MKRLVQRVSTVYDSDNYFVTRKFLFAPCTLQSASYKIDNVFASCPIFVILNSPTMEIGQL